MPNAQTNWIVAKTWYKAPLSDVQGTLPAPFFQQGPQLEYCLMCFISQHSNGRDIYIWSILYPSVSLSAFKTSLYHADQRESVFNKTASKRHSPRNPTCFQGWPGARHFHELTLQDLQSTLEKSIIQPNLRHWGKSDQEGKEPIVRMDSQNQGRVNVFWPQLSQPLFYNAAVWSLIQILFFF